MNRAKNENCPAKLIRRSENNAYVDKYKKEHSHVIDIRHVEVAKKVAKLKDMANTTDKTPREIISEEQAGLSDDVLAQLPSYESMTAAVRMERKGDAPKAPKNLNELRLGEVVTSKNEPFVLFDSGPGNKRTIIFTTQRNLDFLSTCTNLHMDGTESSCPALFDQLYTIHGETYYKYNYFHFISLTNMNNM